MPFRDMFCSAIKTRNLDFSFGGRTENHYETALELVSGADFKCVLHHFPSLARLEGLGAKFGRETTQNLN